MDGFWDEWPTEDMLKEKLGRFQSDPIVRRLDAKRNRRTSLTIFRVRDRENSHSALLDWLFNHSVVGLKAIKLLLLLLLKKGAKLGEVVEVALLTGTLDSATFKSSTEVHQTGKGRPDIQIEVVWSEGGKEKRLVIIIENKIWSSEGDNQTVRYGEIAQELRDKGYAVVGVFLTPILKAEPENGDFVHITYQDLLDSVLQPLLDDDETPEEVKRVLKDYIDSLCTLNDNKKIIAIDMDTKELLNKFFENYKELILAVVTAQAQRLKDEGNDAEANNMVKAQKVLAHDLEVSRDKTKYRIVGLDGQSKGKELSDLNKGGQDSVVVNAVRWLFGAGYKQDDIQTAWKAAVKKEPTDVVRELRDQATFDEDVVTKPSESWLFRLGSNKDDLAERLYVEECGSIINTQTAYNIDYFVYMVNVIGQEGGRKWPIRIEKM